MRNLKQRTWRCLITLVVLMAVGHTAGVDGQDLYTIHIIPHSHMDAGWLKTIDELKPKLNNILTSVVETLSADPEAKYTQGDIFLFSTWYEQQDLTKKEEVKALVQRGQLNFVNGGWISHDEACTTYDDILANMMMGADYLEKEFAVKTWTGWQIDAFGHSSVNAHLYAEMGFNSIFFARISDNLKTQFKSNHRLEFNWQPEFGEINLGADMVNFDNKGSILHTYVMDQHYQTPSVVGLDDFMRGNYKSQNNLKNVADFTERLISYAKEVAGHYQTNHIPIFYGADFSHEQAQETYRMANAIISQVNDKYTGKV